MESTDLTVQILIEIRDQIAQTNHRLDTTNQRLDESRDYLGRRIDDLGRRIDQTNRQLVVTETRLATEISALRGTLHEDQPGPRGLRERVERCERHIDELRQRIG
jgi:predicted  nucleic acid-binding Zn-ribbon protein